MKGEIIMLAELFMIASEFFFFGLIPAIITFVISIILYIKEKRYSVIKSFFISLFYSVVVFIAICIAILIVVYYIGIIAAIILIIGLVLALFN